MHLYIHPIEYDMLHRHLSQIQGLLLKQLNEVQIQAYYYYDQQQYCDKHFLKTDDEQMCVPTFLSKIQILKPNDIKTLVTLMLAFCSTHFLFYKLDANAYDLKIYKRFHIMISKSSDLLLNSLTQFYDKHLNHRKTLSKMIEGKHTISLRVMDWFITHYAKYKNIIYWIDDAEGI